jgi:coproporphyrinogen III oxidase-like Fe-S oxidoreductase
MGKKGAYIVKYERISIHFNANPTLLKFDRQLPTYNWLYPFDCDEQEIADPLSALAQLAPDSGRRALYIHIPFCETICSFCPFVRGEYGSEDEVDRYVRALLKEIEIKHEYQGVRAAPIECIYIGGGTPSVLRVEHYYQLGEALHRYFDLSQLKEFTMECEVKSVTLEKLKAWQDIGVTRTSFGVQTFNPMYRQLFNLTASVDQIRRVAGWVNERFESTNVDMIHSIGGQTLDALLQDVDDVNALQTTTVDYYTLNNSVAQLRMHRAFAEHNLPSLSAHTRLSYRMYLNEYLRSLGYVPNNSYSFTRSTAQPGSPRVVIQRDPIFSYQDITYGYDDDYIDGYGAGARGYFGQFTASNINNREQYMARLLSDKPQDWFFAYRCREGSNKGVVYFSYRGVLEKQRVDWATVEPEVRATLDEVVKNGLAVEKDDCYELTDTGWLYAVNIMYLLMPAYHQNILSESINRREAVRDRQPDDVVFLPRRKTIAPAVLSG